MRAFFLKKIFYNSYHIHTPIEFLTCYLAKEIFSQVEMNLFMKELIIIMTLIFIVNCKEAVKPKPFKIGICVQERSRFMASFSKNAFETYFLKKVVNKGYQVYRYTEKNKIMYYRWISFDQIRKRNLTKVQCPDKNRLQPFEKPDNKS